MNHRLVTPALVAVGFLSTLAFALRHGAFWQPGDVPPMQIPSVLPPGKTDTGQVRRVPQAPQQQPSAPTIEDRSPLPAENDGDPALNEPDAGVGISPMTYQEAQAAQAAHPLRAPRTR